SRRPRRRVRECRQAPPRTTAAPVFRRTARARRRWYRRNGAAGHRAPLRPAPPPPSSAPSRWRRRGRSGCDRRGKHAHRRAKLRWRHTCRGRRSRSPERRFRWRGVRDAWEENKAPRVFAKAIILPPPRSGGGEPCEAWWRGLQYESAEKQSAWLSAFVARCPHRKRDSGSASVSVHRISPSFVGSTRSVRTYSISIVPKHDSQLRLTA